MAEGRPAITWQLGLAASLAIVLALAGAVTVFVRSSDSDDNSASTALKGLSSKTTVSTTTTTTTPAPASTSPPKPAPFVAQDAGFSAEFPVAPAREDSDLSGPARAGPAVSYTETFAGETVSVAAVPQSHTPTGAALAEVLDEFVNGAVERINGSLVSRQTTMVAGQRAELAVISAEQRLVSVCAFYAGGRFYDISGTAVPGYREHPVYDRVLATFRAV
jgi:hypothetical protein